MNHSNPSSFISSFKSRLFILALSFSYSLAVLAHGPGLEKAAQISKQIENQGDQAELFIKRGRVYQDNHLWQEAMQDFDRAAQLDPDYIEFDLDRARLSASAGEPLRALDFVDLYLLREGVSIEALLIQARSFRQVGLHDRAIDAYQQALNNLSQFDGRPSPEWYIEYTDTLLLLDKKEQALEVVQAGIEQIGAIGVFQSKAIDIEVDLGLFDAALGRIDSLLSQSQRKDLLLSRRADILRKAGRTKAAKQGYREAYAALQSLPPRLQKLPVSTELAQSLQARLAD